MFDNDLSFFHKLRKIGKFEKLVCNLNDNKFYVAQKRNLKQALNLSQKVHIVHRIVTE